MLYNVCVQLLVLNIFISFVCVVVSFSVSPKSADTLELLIVISFPVCVCEGIVSYYVNEGKRRGRERGREGGRRREGEREGGRERRGGREGGRERRGRREGALTIECCILYVHMYMYSYRYCWYLLLIVFGVFKSLVIVITL